MSKKFLTSLIVIIVVIGGLVLVYKKAHSPAPTDTVLVSQVVSEEIHIENMADQYASIKGVYPQFVGVSDEFNKSISDFVTQSVNEHKQMVKADWQAKKDTAMPGEEYREFPDNDFYPFQFGWIPAQVNDEYVSFVLTFGGYTGGAHGFDNSKSWNYDVKNNKEVTLAELFPNDSNYLKTISDYTYVDIIKQYRPRLAGIGENPEDVTDDMIPIDMIKAGTAPKEENFQVFTFDKDSITIYFTQYQVGPYVAGEFEVKMPRK